MHHYFIDSSLATPRSAKDLARIETRVTDLGIKGKMTRLTPLHDVASCIRDARMSNADTLVVVGNDQLLSRTIRHLRAHPRLTVGMIPLGTGPFLFARALGLPEGLAACDTLAARRTEMLDVGSLNENELFFSSVEMAHAPYTLECDHAFRVQADPSTRASVQNLLSSLLPKAADCPTDGRFTVLFASPVSSRWRRTPRCVQHTSFAARAVRIVPSAEELIVTIDGFRRVRAPLIIEILPRHLAVIVGKERTF